LAVINDLGETVDIHPLRKKEVAERIALCLDRLVYNKKVNLSPEVVTAEVKDGKIILTLDQPIQPGELFSFEIAGDDGKFHNAQATASGSSITILPPPSSLLSPRAIRYAWKDNPLQANVRSLGGLPMSSFELKVAE
jgi:sialate O-acetylesterase